MKHIRRKVILRAKADRYEFETMREISQWLHRQLELDCTLEERATKWFLPVSWMSSNFHATLYSSRKNKVPAGFKYWSNNSK